MQQVKVLLGIKDELQDAILEVIEQLTMQHFLSYVGDETVPPKLDWLIIEVMVKRYNRLGSEGMTNQSAEGISMTFDLSDFEPYEDILKRLYKESRNVGVKFL